MSVWGCLSGYARLGSIVDVGGGGPTDVVVVSGGVPGSLPCSRGRRV